MPKNPDKLKPLETSAEQKTESQANRTARIDTRINQVEEELGGFVEKARSEEDKKNIKEKREAEYVKIVAQMEKKFGKPLGEESKKMVRERLVDDAMEKASKENAHFDELRQEVIDLYKQKGLHPFSISHLENDMQRIRHLDTGERSISPERKAELERGLDELAALLEDSGVRWQLDGALNFSMYKGEFVRDHKDIDLSVLSKDMPKFLQALQKKGYGIFEVPQQLNKRETVMARGVAVFKSVNAEEAAKGGNLRFMPINEQGEPISSSGIMNMYDLHVKQQDKNGDIILKNGNKMPKEWFENVPSAETINGREVRLSDPVVFVYHKVADGGRAYDWTDLEEYKKFLLSENRTEELGRVKDEVGRLLSKDIEIVKKEVGDGQGAEAEHKARLQKKLDEAKWRLDKFDKLFS